MPPVALTPATLQLIPLTELHESPLNPRQHFDPVQLASLTDSMRQHGQLTPVLVRPRPAGGYELAAGHRRYRAAKAAAIGALEAKVRELDDAAFAEILTIENDEREDIHPLEQAQGYRLLMEKAGYDVARIASRVQRSHDFVYDRLGLLRLIPALKKHFLDGHFELGHAVLLSRLSTDQQEQLNDVGGADNGRYSGTRDVSGLWRIDYSLFDDEDEKSGRWAYQAHSVGELKRWIDDHIRFRPEAEVLEELFPETAVVLEAAQETGTKIIYITHSYRVSDEARDAKIRTIGNAHWKRADGEPDAEGNPSQACEHAVVGIFAAGKDRGQAIGVCVTKGRCAIHWKAEAAAAERRKKQKAKADAGDSKAKAAVAKADVDVKLRRKQQERTWAVEKAISALVTSALLRTIAEASVDACGTKGSIGRFVLEGLSGSYIYVGDISRTTLKDAPKSGSAGDVVRFVARCFAEACSEDSDTTKWACKALGVDLKPFVAQAEASVPLVGAPAPKTGKKDPEPLWDDEGDDEGDDE